MTAQAALPHPAPTAAALGLSAACTKEVADIAKGWDHDYILRMYGDVLAAASKPPRDPDANFLRWLRAFTRGRSPASASVAVSAVLIKPLLKQETIDEAASIAPGRDVGELERAWWSWVEKQRVAPDLPDRAFVGWVRKVTKAKRLSSADGHAR